MRKWSICSCVQLLGVGVGVAFGSMLGVGGEQEGIVVEDVMDDVFFLVVFIFVEMVGV